ncbi:MAG TPA: YgeY family selenium metabolism-linked hydrolase [Clostridia bacterium]|nr:YgeY family selenium metabolism-linked hydrolase [Clostridia bacterium]
MKVRLNTEKRSNLTELCRKFVSIPSYTGQERDLAQCIKDTMESLGYDRAWIDDLGNVIGLVKGEKPGKKVLFDGHLDTVSVGDVSEWVYDPFQGKVEGGKVYGRGTSDMKGALAAMVFAVGELAQNRAELSGEIYVSGTVHEEIAEGVSLGYILEEIKPQAVVIGEATELKVNIGQRGRGEIVIETRGKAAHSSNPEVGINAVYQMMKVIQAIGDLELPQDELLGPAIMELTDILSSPYPGASVVPENCRVTYDRRLLVGDSEEGILGDIEGLLQKLRDEDPSFQASVYLAENDYSTYKDFKVKRSRFAPAWKMEKEHWIVRRALAALRGAGLPQEISAYSFCTNGSSSAGIYSIPTIGFGPGREKEAHTVNEYLELEQLFGAASGYFRLALALGQE